MGQPRLSSPVLSICLTLRGHTPPGKIWRLQHRAACGPRCFAVASSPHSVLPDFLCTGPDPHGRWVDSRDCGTGVDSRDSGPGADGRDSGPRADSYDSGPGADSCDSGPGVDSCDFGPGVDSCDSDPGVDNRDSASEGDSCDSGPSCSDFGHQRQRAGLSQMAHLGHCNPPVMGSHPDCCWSDPET